MNVLRAFFLTIVIMSSFEPSLSFSPSFLAFTGGAGAARPAASTMPLSLSSTTPAAASSSAATPLECPPVPLNANPFTQTADLALG